MQIFFRNGLRCAPHLDIRPVALVNPVQRIATTIVWVVSTATARSTVVATAIAVLVVVIVVLALARPVSVVKIQVITPAKMPPQLLKLCVTSPKINPVEGRTNLNPVVMVANFCRRYVPLRNYRPQLQLGEMFGILRAKTLFPTYRPAPSQGQNGLRTYV